MWIEKNRDQATGNELERALKRINREDIINQCMHNFEAVTDEDEKRQAMVCLDVEPKPVSSTESSELTQLQSEVPPALLSEPKPELQGKQDESGPTDLQEHAPGKICVILC